MSSPELVIETPGPGVYPGIDMSTYHRWDAASNSRMSTLLRSPAHLKTSIDDPDNGGDTEAKRFGRAAHVAIIEPDHFTIRYREADKCIGLTGKGAPCTNHGTWPLAEGGTMCTTHLHSAAYKGTPTAEGVDVLSHAHYAACLAMRGRVSGKLRASGLIAGIGEAELSIVWIDEATGLKCKARLDRYSPEIAGGALVDLKTTTDASSRAFERAIFNFGYNRQGSFYLDGAKAVGLKAEHFVILAIEKVPPYEVGVFRLTEGALDAGGEMIRVLLRQYAECLEKDEWPGYPDEVRDIALPDWAWRQIDDDIKELTGEW